VFAGISADDALPVLDEVRRVVEETAFTVRGRLRPRKKPDQPKDKRGKSRKQLHVTISIGVAERGPRQDSPMQVIQAADRALYRAKDAGRNRVGT
jgi:diguanylate cyclase (GGDEF)-like protein